MASVFTKIIRGELPGRFVWEDEQAVAFLTIAPIRQGHTLVVPREEIDHWLDLPEDLSQHLQLVARKVGKGIQRAFDSPRVGLVIAGFEVPHVHLHVTPMWSLDDIAFANQDPNPDPKALDESAQRIRTALDELGFQRSHK